MYNLMFIFTALFFTNILFASTDIKTSNIQIEVLNEEYKTVKNIEPTEKD